MQEEILEAVRTAVRELIRTAKLGQGDLLVVGCSSSEILGEAIGTHSSADAADAVVSALFPNDPQRILAHAPIEAVFCTGQKAFSLYRRFWEKPAGRAAVRLSSTSPANCRVSSESLCAAYAAVRDICEKNTR